MIQHVVRSAIWPEVLNSVKVGFIASSARAFLPAASSIFRPIPSPTLRTWTTPIRTYRTTAVARATFSPISTCFTQPLRPRRIAQFTAQAWRASRSNTSQQARLSSSWNPKARQTEESHHCTACNRRFKSDDSHVRARHVDQSEQADAASSTTGQAHDHTKQTHDHTSQANVQSRQAHEEAKHHHSLLNRLPHLHRPTKEELLAAATGFWQRLGVRFKWLTIRSARPFNTDDFSAFISWILAAHLLWIILGTTTFLSVAVLAINSIFAQETLAGWIGSYLTKSTGVKVVFESAVVPKWKDGVITFKNVFVSRRPGQGQANVSKGSSMSAAAAAKAAAAGGKDHNVVHEKVEEEDTNYTQFDVTINTINVTLSFTKWFNGKGLLRDVEIKGVRGVIDRTCVLPGDPNIDPRSYRHEHNPGDFEIDAFKVEDVLLTVYQPNNFRPFSVSIYSCDLPRLRKQWLYYDLMSANMISGSFDDSLFTIHPRQTHNQTGLSIDDTNGDPTQWKKHSRLRIDGLNIDHLNRGVEGPFSWIHEGNVDLVADIMFPADQDGSIAKVMSDFYDRMEATVRHGYIHTTHQHDMSDHHDEEREHTVDDDRFVVMDLRVHLNDVKAAVPIFTKDLSYVNNALIRPIVAYINSKRAFIPVNCRVVKRVSEFDGSWTIFDSGLLDDMSKEVRLIFFKLGADAAAADIWIDL